MTRLTVEQIIAADDLGEQDINIPEWGGTVRVRGLGYGEWVDIRDAATVGGKQDERLFARHLFAAAITDPIVTPEQADLMIGKSAAAVNALVDAIVTLSHVEAGAVTESEATFQGQ